MALAGKGVPEQAVFDLAINTVRTPLVTVPGAAIPFPFGGKFPTLGTNPHSWGFPTTAALGYPIVIDWATSVVAMGRVQQLAREGKQLPPGAAVDANGQPTTDPNEAKYLVPFGAHKGYGLALMNEIIGGFIGGSLPTIRNRWDKVGDDKGTCCFFFQVWHPDAMNAGNFAKGRSQSENVKAVIDDILGHGNENCMLPGQMEAQAAARCAKTASRHHFGTPRTETRVIPTPNASTAPSVHAVTTRTSCPRSLSPRASESRYFSSPPRPII